MTDFVADLVKDFCILLSFNSVRNLTYTVNLTYPLDMYSHAYIHPKHATSS